MLLKEPKGISIIDSWVKIEINPPSKINNNRQIERPHPLQIKNSKEGALSSGEPQRQNIGVTIYSVRADKEFKQ